MPLGIVFVLSSDIIFSLGCISYVEIYMYSINITVPDTAQCLHVYFSWGPDDDGKTVDGPHVLAAVSLKAPIRAHILGSNIMLGLIFHC